MSKITFDFSDPAEDGHTQTSDNPKLRNFNLAYDSVRDILTDYVQPDSTLSLSDAVRAVARFWDASDSTNAVVMVPTDVAEQIPYDHPSHKKLAEFMVALHDSGEWTTESDTERLKSQRRQFWDCFCGFLSDNNWSLGPKDEKPMEYANRCAFYANLNFPESESTRFFYVMARAALDDAVRLDPGYPAEIREAQIIGASQFIILQAAIIYDNVIKQCQREAELAEKNRWHRRLFRGKQRLDWKPEESFYEKDWQTWKRMFRAVAVDETYTQISRDLAQRSADLMALQEKIQDDRSTGS